MIQFNKIWAAAGVAACLTSGVRADSEDAFISYSFAEIGIAHDNFNANGLTLTDGEGLYAGIGEGTGNGVTGKLSSSLPLAFGRLASHIVLDFTRTSHDPGVSLSGSASAGGILDVNQQEFRVALGMNYPFGSSSIFTELGIASRKISYGDFEGVDAEGTLTSLSLTSASASDVGLDVKAGLRHRFGKVEITGYARYSGLGSIRTTVSDVTNFQSKVKAGVGAVYHFSHRFAISGDYEFSTPGRARLMARLTF